MTLGDRAIELALEARRQRRALFIFIAVVALLLVFCAVVGFRMLTPPPKTLLVGRVADFADGQPHRISVPKLELSSLITRRDATLSEDTVFVRHASDGSWVALLGVDTLSGCFLYWDATVDVFQDVNCQGSRYTIDGKYIDGLNTGEQPQNMARLVVEVREDQVFVRDERVRER
ncbi:MAG: hypothetical protein JST60_12250 [Chloroflexi bacterium SZAS-1]|jgi:Rieske Fe-S protein|nr:hypothetical protein [Chloroflexi bacterium SZAS-1]HNP86943.1 hypothetical protein [Kouleothrix sp.]